MSVYQNIIKYTYLYLFTYITILRFPDGCQEERRAAREMAACMRHQDEIEVSTEEKEGVERRVETCMYGSIYVYIYIKLYMCSTTREI